MGACLCVLGNSATPDRPPDRGAAKTTHGGTESSTKPVKMRKKQYSHGRENREAQVCNTKNMCKVLTLEDLIMASPGFNRGDQSQYLHMHHRQSSKKIHPSFDGDCKKELLPAGCSAVELSMEAEEARYGELKKYSSSERSRKLKKKVSFRSPEVAEVFVIASPEFELRNLIQKESITF